MHVNKQVNNCEIRYRCQIRYLATQPDTTKIWYFIDNYDVLWQKILLTMSLLIIRSLIIASRRSQMTKKALHLQGFLLTTLF